MCLGDDCTLVASSEDGHRGLNHQVQQGADHCNYFLPIGRKLSLVPPVRNCSSEGSGSSEILGTELSQLLCAALSVSQHAPAVLGAAHRGSQLLLLSYFVYTQMLNSNTSQVLVPRRPMSFIFCFLRGRY